MLITWPCPGRGGTTDEFAFAIDRGRAPRLLVVPALFDEMNRMRRTMVRALRLLDAQGVDSILPDLPGTGESLEPIEAQSLRGWRDAMAHAARQFRATHVLTLRGGVLVFPNALPGWVFEPVSGAGVLRQMLRARIIASREAGVAEDSAGLVALGREQGVVLAGHRFGPAMVAGLESARPLDEGQREVRQSELGGAALWSRAEPGDDRVQAERLCALIVAELGA